MRNTIPRALVRARFPMVTMALTYVGAVGVGIAMVQTGNAFALHQRNALLATANRRDPALLALQQGNQVGAALLDFARNLLLGTVPTTASGPSIVVSITFKNRSLHYEVRGLQRVLSGPGRSPGAAR